MKTVHMPYEIIRYFISTINLHNSNSLFNITKTLIVFSAYQKLNYSNTKSHVTMWLWSSILVIVSFPLWNTQNNPHKRWKWRTNIIIHSYMRQKKKFSYWPNRETSSPAKQKKNYFYLANIKFPCTHPED